MIREWEIKRYINWYHYDQIQSGLNDMSSYNYLAFSNKK